VVLLWEGALGDGVPGDVVPVGAVLGEGVGGVTCGEALCEGWAEVIGSAGAAWVGPVVD